MVLLLKVALGLDDEEDDDAMLVLMARGSLSAIRYGGMKTSTRYS